MPNSAVRASQSNPALGILLRALAISQVHGQRSLRERTLLLGSAVQASQSNPAFGVLSRVLAISQVHG